jgi:hypothetical protein
MGIINLPENRPGQAQADAGTGKAEKPFTRIEDEIQQTHWRNQLSKTGINLVYTGRQAVRKPVYVHVLLHGRPGAAGK